MRGAGSPLLPGTPNQTLTRPSARRASTRAQLEYARLDRGLVQLDRAQGLHATRVLGTLLDGIARHTAEGLAFQRRAMQAGFREAVRERDQPFGDHGASTFKG